MTKPTTQKNVLMVAYYFPPQGTVGTIRALKLTKYLPALGWRPFVLTIKENRKHNQDASLMAEIPDDAVVFRTSTLGLDRLQSFIKRMVRNQTSKKTRATGNAGARRGGLQARISAWTLNADEVINWLPFAVRQGLAVIKRNDIDLIYSSSPPNTCHLTGYLLHKLSGKPWVADFRDPWRNNPFSKLPTGFHRRTVDKLEALVMRTACRVVSTSPDLTADFLKTYPAYRDKFQTITNGFDPDDFDSSLASPADGKLNITYAGSFYSYGKDDQITPAYFLEAVKELLAENPGLDEVMNVNFIGSGDVGNVITGLGLERAVSDLGYMTHKQCLRYLQQADVLLLIVGKDYVGSIPAKVFEYMAAQKPILALAARGAATNLLEASGLVSIVPPDDVGLIKEALFDLCRQHEKGWSQSERVNDTKKFAWPNIAGDFNDIFRSCELAIKEPTASPALNMTDKLNDVDRLIVRCVRQDESNASDAGITYILDGVDWQELLDRSNLHGVTAFVYQALERADAEIVPVELMGRLRDSWLAGNARGLVLREELSKLLQEFETRGIKCMPIKGALLDEVVYRRPGMRAYTDIDILVQPADLAEAATLLKGLGFASTGEKDALAKKDGRTQYHFVNDAGVIVDLHWGLVNNRWYPTLSKFFEENIWNNAVYADFQDGKIRSMSPEVLLIYQCTHAAVHHNFSKLILLKDIEQTLRYQPSLDWGSVVRLARQYRMMTICYYSLRFTRDLLDAPVPETVLRQLHPAFLSARLFDRFVNKEGVMEIANDRRAWAQQTWMILRDDYADRARAVRWRLFPSVAWFRRFYPFLPKLPEPAYYPFYPLLLGLRLIRRPNDQNGLRRRSLNGAD